MTDLESRLLDLLKSRALKLGRFTLRSGAVSNYYLDGRLASACAQGAFLIGAVLYERLRGLAFEAVGGPATGAIPLMTAVLMTYHLRGRDVNGFWVRDRIKDHGTGQQVEGYLQAGSKVVLLEDVVTTGESVLAAAQVVGDAGASVVQILSLVDRLAGAEGLFRKHQLNYASIFTIRDLGVES